VIPVDDQGQILLDAFQDLLSDRARFVAIAHVSNALGAIVPVRQVVEMAHAGAPECLSTELRQWRTPSSIWQHSMPISP